MEYVWYDIQYTSMHGTVYKYTIYQYAWYSIQVYKVIERLDGVMVGSVHTQYAGTPLGC